MSRTILEEIRSSGFRFSALAESCPELLALKGVPQNQAYHAEGDVYVHTKLACEMLTQLAGWQRLNAEEQALLFLAAAFHDIGKRACTRLEDGSWTAPRHTIVGEKEFRGMVYRDAKRFGLTVPQRELAAKLIRYHGMPVWFWTKKRPEADLIRAAESIPLRLLYLLSLADVTGREATAKEEFQERVELFAYCARELDIWESPYSFADAYTRFWYFQKEDLWHGACLYDDTAFDVLLLSGLPLAGKDSWIAEHGAGWPVISLDDIREELGYPPAKGSDYAAHLAKERARELLRRGEPFIWNATNIIRDTRQKLVQLFAGYHARVHILYLEAPYEELLARNQSRERYIPVHALEEMIRKLEIPEPWEAYEVTRCFV